jgi:hypothetical protein
LEPAQGFVYVTSAEQWLVEATVIYWKPVWHILSGRQF